MRNNYDSRRTSGRRTSRGAAPSLAGSPRSALAPRFPFTTVAAGCALLVCAAYANFFDNAFQFDDASVLVNNVFIRSLGNIPRFFADARTFSSFPPNMTYRPLVSTTLAIDYAIGGGLVRPVFHASQLLMLLALGALLVAFYSQVMRRASPGSPHRGLAIFTATLFCVHVVNTETMNLMHVRSELLSTIGLVAAFVVYGSGSERPRTWASLLPMAIGAFAKIPVVLFAPLLFVWEYLEPSSAGASANLRRRERFWHATRAAAPATIAGVLLYAFVERVMRVPTQTYGGTDSYHYALTQAWAWVHYVRLFFLPVGLTADTDLALIRDWYDPRVLAGVALVALLCAIAWRTARRREHRPIAFGIAWFMLSLLPASSVLPLAEPVNEHRAFVAHIGLALSVTWAARLAFDALSRAWTARARAAVPAACCAAILCAHAIGTHHRNRVWHTDETLWADVTAKSPENGRAWMNYGVALMARARWQPARVAFERAAQLIPAYPHVYVNLGVLAGATGDVAEAELNFKRALALGPDEPVAHDYYARWLVDQGRAEEAIPLLARSLEIAPADEQARTLLSRLRPTGGAGTP